MLSVLSQEDPTSSANEMRWTPISNAPESYTSGESYYLHPQIPSHTSSSSWGDTSTDGGVDTTSHFGVQRDSASPSGKKHKIRDQDYHDATIEDPSVFSRSHAPGGSADPWPSHDEHLKPSPTSPPTASPHRGITPDIHPYGFQNAKSSGQPNLTNRPASQTLSGVYIPRTHCQRPDRQLSQTPLSRSVSQDEEPSSASPSHSDIGISHKTSIPATTVSRKKPRRKAHNAIERRYRIRLNEKIAELRDSIPSLRVTPRSPSDGNSKDELIGSAHKVNKANVLEKATEYIKSLEMCNRRLQEELNRIVSLSRNSISNFQMQPVPISYPMMENGYAGIGPTVQTDHVPEMFAYINRDS